MHDADEDTPHDAPSPWAPPQAPPEARGQMPPEAPGQMPPQDSGEPSPGEDTPSTVPGATPAADDVALARQLAAGRDAIRTEIAKVIVGQDAVIDLLLVALFARGHAVFVGVPGLAKTLLVQTLAKALALSFQRIQFTPDLMPSDITGTEVLEEDRTTGRRSFRFLPGPLFANVLLADEINRTPPKTQAALLQAMQEKEVTAGGRTHALPDPFLAFATQNPIEQEGTYPLPEAQLDRFMLSIHVGYPSEAEERRIVETTTSSSEPQLVQVLSAEDILEFQALVRRVPIAERLTALAVRIVRVTRPNDETAGSFVKEWVEWGAGPRASQHLVLAAKARSVLRGRFAVDEEDVRSLAQAVLRHRIVVNFRAEADRIDADAVVADVLGRIRA